MDYNQKLVKKFLDITKTLDMNIFSFDKPYHQKFTDRI